MTLQAVLYLLAVLTLILAAVLNNGRVALLGAAFGVLAYAWPVVT